MTTTGSAKRRKLRARARRLVRLLQLYTAGLATSYLTTRIRCTRPQLRAAIDYANDRQLAQRCKRITCIGRDPITFENIYRLTPAGLAGYTRQVQFGLTPNNKEAP